MATAEEKAKENGWVPQEEYKGNPEDWVSAEVFNTRGEFIGKIRASDKKNKALESKLAKVEKTLAELSKHHAKVRETERAAAMKELKAAKVEAVKEGDGAAVVEIDDQIEAIKEEEQQEKVEAQQAAAQQPDGEEHPEVAAFRSEHAEYDQNSLLMGALNAAVQEELEANPDGSPGEILAAAHETVYAELPQLFGADDDTSEEMTQRHSKVGETTRRTKGKRSRSNTGPSASDLDEFQKSIGQTFVNSGAVKDLNEYAQQLAALGEL